MDLQASTTAVEAELQTRRVPFDLAELLACLADSARAVGENPDPSLRADAFRKRQGFEVKFRQAFAEGRVPYVRFMERDAE
jgi:hypothetical protein